MSIATRRGRFCCWKVSVANTVKARISYGNDGGGHILSEDGESSSQRPETPILGELRFQLFLDWNDGPALSLFVVVTINFV